MPDLLSSGDPPDAHCTCGALAAGPCARCHTPVCGDCCVLTEGGASTWAICLRCDVRSGRSLRGPWLTVAGWLLVPLLLLAIAVALLSLATRPQ